MKTVLMAGGQGIRIRPLCGDLPKPMLPLDGKPVLERAIGSLRQQGLTDLVITVSHLGEAIMSYFGDGSRFGVRIQYYHEEVPLGNAGALFRLRNELGAEPFFLLNADTVFDADLRRMLMFHRKKRAKATLFTHPNSHPYDSALLVPGADQSVAAWLTAEDERPAYYQNCVNAGLHIIDPSVLDSSGIDAAAIGRPDPVTGEPCKVDLDRQILKPLAGSGQMFCYQSPEYVRDMGTPERFRAVEADLRAGLVESRSLRRRQRAIFLDRDGTINRYVGFLRSPEQLELIDGAAQAIRAINASGYLCIVVTNQPVVARGEVTPGQLREIHNRLETLLGAQGAWLDGIYVCPHHPDRGFPGEVPELKFDCDCRKPKPGLLLRAARDLNIDLAGSWMVGDSDADVEAGRAAGCQTARIGAAGAGLCVSSLKEFADKVLA